MNKVALIAEAFGFGPAAKAWAIGKVLAEEMNCTVDYFGSESAYRYFSTQGIGVYDTADVSSALATLKQRDYDAYISVLAPEWVEHLSDRLECTYYVDSLGFMWNQADISPLSSIYSVKRYFAQDIFDSVANLEILRFSNLTPVSGIVAPLLSSGAESAKGVLVNLGGLTNPVVGTDVSTYLSFAADLTDALMSQGTADGPVTVAMNDSLAGSWEGQVGTPRQFDHEQMQQAIHGHELVVSSPGLTTLIEASAASANYLPLPPQNWSQVQILRKMVTTCGPTLQAAWRLLADSYADLPESASEAAKVRLVQQRNFDLCRDDTFRVAYAEACTASAPSASQGLMVGAPFSGATEICRHLALDMAL